LRGTHQENLASAVVGSSVTGSISAKNIPVNNLTSNSVVIPPRSVTKHKAESTKALSCPKCDKEKNLNINALKLHLICKHYTHYWKDLVPDSGETTLQCELCSKKMTANHALGARNSLMCHRAMQHEELELAIQDDIEEFPDELFQLLFGRSEQQQPTRKVLYSKNYPLDALIQQNNRGSQIEPNFGSRDCPAFTSTTTQNTSRSEIEFDAKGMQMVQNIDTKVCSAEQKMNQSEHVEKKVMPKKENMLPGIKAQPYVRKRLKQDLSSLESGSECEVDDPDEDWSPQPRPKKMALKQPVAKTRRIFADFSSDSSDD